MISLRDAVERYDLEREVSSSYIYQLGYAVSRFEAFLKREATTDDLNETVINRWLKFERENDALSDRSRLNIRRSLLTLWQRFGSRPPDRGSIRSVVVTPKNPEAWHFDELQAVADAAADLPGMLPNGVRRALYFPTCLWFAYETGLRRTDVWGFDMRLFDSDCRAAFTQHKTKRVHLITITQETMADINKIRRIIAAEKIGDPDRTLAWPQCESQFYYWLKVAREEAGVDAELPNRALQHIRRTGATQVDIQGDKAYRFLGHAREGLDRASYIDRRKTVSPTTPLLNRHGNRP